MRLEPQIWATEGILLARLVQINPRGAAQDRGLFGDNFNSIVLLTSCDMFCPDPSLEQAWYNALQALRIEPAALFAESVCDPTRRVYAYQNRIHKVALVNYKPASAPRQQTLFGEWLILSHCGSISGVPEAIKYYRDDNVEVLVIGFIAGTPLNEACVSLFSACMILARLSLILFQLSLRGISHSDILPHNVLVGEGGKVFLIDFDQAVEVSIWQAFTRNYLRRANSEIKVYGSFATIVKYLVRRLFREGVSNNGSS